MVCDMVTVRVLHQLNMGGDMKEIFWVGGLIVTAYIFFRLGYIWAGHHHEQFLLRLQQEPKFYPKISTDDISERLQKEEV